MAMNGNAYKMIEIKKVSGPVVPLRKDFEIISLSLSLSLSSVFCNLSKECIVFYLVTQFLVLNLWCKVCKRQYLNNSESEKIQDMFQFSKPSLYTYGQVRTAPKWT